MPPLHFCSSDYFGQKELIKKKLSDFWLVGLNFAKFFMSYLKSQVGFSLNFASLIVSWEISLLYFFDQNFIWLRQKEPIKLRNFSLFTAHVKFHQISTLVGSFYCKHVKFKLKQYVSWHWRVIQNLKKNWFVVSKITRFWWNLTWTLEILKLSFFIGSIFAKCITFDLKK